MADRASVELRFFAGTLEARGAEADLLAVRDLLHFDPRTGCHRAPAAAYPAVVLGLRAAGVPVQDGARRWQPLTLRVREPKPPRPYQQAALRGWQEAGRRGVVVLPTGAGKTLVAVMAIADVQRPALVVAPTLELVRQWSGVLANAFGVPIGVVGGGEHRVEALTVTTYDSAWMQMPHLGDRFALLVFDEAHHLPSDAYQSAATMALAPYRLGLTATPERTDGQHERYDDLCGPIVHRAEIVELSGLWLADYDTERVLVDMDDDERALFEEARACYRGFCADAGIRLGEPDGFARFLRLGGRSPEGREALAAYRLQRRLAFGSRAKLRQLSELLHRFAHEPTLIFTDDNATAYTISRSFLVPVITHQTRLRERIELLAGLRSGRYGALVTSRVLNEGVDVPEAAVAIVVSGTGTVREHVQRLGRVLRKVPGKRALLVELVSADTGETLTSARRRDHIAYR